MQQKILVIITIGLLMALTCFMAIHFMPPKENIGTPIEAQQEAPKPAISSNIELTISEKTSKNDNDLEITQSYKAEVNGKQIEVPIVATDSSTNGTKAVVVQEIDMTNVISYAASMERERAKQEFKKNWELGAGYGIHKGDSYLALEVQRNYSKNKAVSCEIHQDIKDLNKTTGWELKHKWMF